MIWVSSYVGIEDVYKTPMTWPISIGNAAPGLLVGTIIVVPMDGLGCSGPLHLFNSGLYDLLTQHPNADQKLHNITMDLC